MAVTRSVSLMVQVCPLLMLVRPPFCLVPLVGFIFAMSFASHLSLVLYFRSVSSPMIMMCFVNFTRFISSLRIEPHGRFCLEVASTRVCMRWRRPPRRSSASFVRRRSIGMPGLVILRLP
jgi:hypothetical protein